MIRKMLNTTMIIQVVKDYLLRSILKIKHTKGKLPYERIVEDTLRILLDGNCNSGN